MNDSIIQVRRMRFKCGSVFTAVWISKNAQKALADFERSNEGAMFSKKLEQMARLGFENFEGKSFDAPIQHASDGVWRIGIKITLFRLLGYYANGAGFKRKFHAIEAGFKPGRKRGRKLSEKVDKVVRVRDLGLVREVEP